MFEQKPPKIKEAIADFLRGIDNKTEKEILANVRHLTTGETPQKSINRTLNELYEKGILEKLYLKDGTFFSWKKEFDHVKRKQLERYYKLISEQYRKGVSTTIYIGTNQTGNQDNNPNYNPDSDRYRGADKSPRKTPTDLKAWLFDDIENIDENRFDVLSEFLYLKITSEKLSSDNADGVFTQLDIFGTYAGTNKRRNENTISLAEFRMMLGSDMVMPFQDKDDKIFNPKTKKPMFWSLRDVQQ